MKKLSKKNKCKEIQLDENGFIFKWCTRFSPMESNVTICSVIFRMLSVLAIYAFFLIVGIGAIAIVGDTLGYFAACIVAKMWIRPDVLTCINFALIGYLGIIAIAKYHNKVTELNFVQLLWTSFKDKTCMKIELED